MKIIFRLLLILPMAFTPVIFAQDQGNKKTEVTIIRGKVMGYTAVSPALQQQLEEKYGKKPAKDPQSMGSNAQVGKHGFVYVSPQVDKGKKN